MKVLVLHNPVAGTSAPDDLDTLTQVRAVEQGLRGLGHQVETLCFEAGEGMRHALEKAGPELVFNLVESVDGTSRRAHLAPALLEALGVPFTGAAAEPLRRSTNKLTAKAALTEAGVPTPAWRTLDGAGEDLPLSGPWLVKSVWEHASLGLEEDSVLRPQTLAELMDEMRSRRTDLGGECFAEAYIHGREFNLSLLQSSNGPEVLPPAELRFEGWAPDRARVVGYKAKWLEESPEYRSTVRRFDFPGQDAPLLERLSRTAVHAWLALELSGYARIDFRVDADGSPLVIDVNANPCIAPDAGFQAAAAEAGLSYPGLLARILQAARNRPSSRAADRKDHDRF